MIKAICMKTTLSFLLILFTLNIQAQHDYQLTTLDSIVTTTSSQGVYGLTSIVKNNTVHLAYIHGTVDQEWQLIYELRKSGQQILREVVHQYPSAPWLWPRTAIQFDENDSPFIYCAQITGGQTYILTANKTSGVWQTNTIDYKHRNNWLHTSGDINEEIGFVSEKAGDASNSFQPVIHYFNYANNVWLSQTVSASPYPKGRPVSFHNGDEVYVAFAEQRTDTVQLNILKKSANSWNTELVLTFPESPPANNHWCKFGLVDGNIHFFHTYDVSEYSQPLTHMIKTNSEWKEVPIEEGREQYLFAQWEAGNNIDVDQEGNLYFANRDYVYAIDPDNVYHEYENPVEGPYYACLDIAIIDDEIYLYFIGGNKDFPFGDPVMFYEAIGSLTGTSSTIEFDNPVIVNYNLSPNPGNGEYVLNIETAKLSKASIQWINTLGRKAGPRRDYILNKGLNSIQLSNENLESNLYYLRVATDQGVIVIPVVQNSGN